MNRTRNYIINILLVMLPSQFCFAQTPLDSAAVSKNLDRALNDFQQQDSLFLDPEFKKDLKNQYAQKIFFYRPELYNERTKQLIAYYSTAAGMLTILRQYLKNTNGLSSRIYPLEILMDEKIIFSLPSDPEIVAAPMPTFLPNKYATLLMELQPMDKNASLYLNGKLICLLSQAKNGIRVHSGEKYKVEIRSGRKKICAKEIILSQQEKKVDQCFAGK